VDENPWWAIYHHECPKCHSIQIPRFDIALQNNAIESDPNVVALYGEGIDDGEMDGFEGYTMMYDDDNDDNDESCTIDDMGETGEDIKIALLKESMPFDSEGFLAHEQASKLLILMVHARTCSGLHVSPKHAEVCQSAKFLMLHIRDCIGSDVNGQTCRFSWCGPCKKMLKHLTRCNDSKSCQICNSRYFVNMQYTEYIF
jgi:hypothetical protein